MTAIALSSLTKQFGDINAVDDLSLRVDKGVLFGFLGPNGAGKTTTIRMMLGLIKPSAGDVQMLERPVWEPKREVLNHVGSIVEEPTFWKYLSGRKNLEYLARAGTNAADRKARLSRIDETIHRVDLQEAAGKRVKAYSHGMKQRLGIAAALLGAPEILVLDEPTNGLDPQGIREMRILLRSLASDGTTVFVSSHLLAEVEAMCDRVAVLARGRLVAEGPPSQLRGDVTALRMHVDDAEAAARILAALDAVSIERTSGNEIVARLTGKTLPADVNAALVRGGVAVGALIPERSSLEDVFLNLVEDAETPR